MVFLEKDSRFRPGEKSGWGQSGGEKVKVLEKNFFLLKRNKIKEEKKKFMQGSDKSIAEIFARVLARLDLTLPIASESGGDG